MKEYFLYPVCKFLDFFIPRKIKDGIPILLYHSISNSKSQLSVAPEVFEKQMDYLHSQGYKTIIPDDLLKINNYSKKIILTFDDGFKDNYIVALPILKKYNFVGTIFIATGHIEKNNEHSHGEKNGQLPMLNEVEIKELGHAGWPICNHFDTHRDLDKLSDKEVEKEYLRAKDRLNKMLDCNNVSNIVSYPHGRYNNKVISILENLGVKMAFNGGGQKYRKQDNLFIIPRKGVVAPISLTKFKLYLSFSFVKLKKIINSAVKK